MPDAHPAHGCHKPDCHEHHGPLIPRDGATVPANAERTSE